ncbi:glycosyltransferase family 2 protein [Lutibacter sp. B1]|uniref:glycosyltransferase family 2 protein n=1 Tax=Lutibacter sp. B1 TaxID=2725996 RepID=UPI001456D2F1|nr:glycosyltransferase [Lutibacter sp. B1]NLP58151.1 glycosyltransferase family 2 protein [Lutibacter sp. B1]
MEFSLIICTYQRPDAIIKLSKSVKQQTLYPDEILIIDGSFNNETQNILKKHRCKNLKYFKVDDKNRGLTKQRNFGISKVSETSEIICFLDDDTILAPTYFEKLIATYEKFPKAIGVGGYIMNEVDWKPLLNLVCSKNQFCIDGFSREEGTRFELRKKLGLIDETPPGFMPKFSHGRSISYLPPSNKIYNVEFFMGGVSSFKKELFQKIQFSTYFEGYGLYEDLDFCLRASKIGKLYVNTSAKLEHHHEESGRPNKFLYGKMVVRNGWYVWRVKYPKPSFESRLRFHLNILVLMKIRFWNSLSGNQKKQAFTESLGRFVGWLSLFFNTPKLKQ